MNQTMRILTTVTGDELTERNIITLMQKVARPIMFCKCELIIQNQTSHDGDQKLRHCHMILQLSK